DVVARAYRRMERQIRVLLADRINVLAVVAHASAQRSGFDDVDAVDAVDEIDQSAAVDGDVVRRWPVGAGRGVRHEVTDFPRRVRIGEVDKAQPLREPGERHDAAGEALGWLMATRHRRLRRPVNIETRDLERRDRYR